MKTKHQKLFSTQSGLPAQAGFTLVELMVSLTLFTIVVLALVSSLYTVNNASRKSQAIRSVIDNLNFAVESMSRTIRTGNAVACGGESNLPSLGGEPNCTLESQSPSDTLYIDSTLGVDQEVEYRLGQNPDGTGTGTIQKKVKEGGIWGNYYSITAPEIDVQSLSFYVNGARVDDLVQPHVMMFVRGVATVNEETQPFAIQTYLSQRAVD